MKRSLICAVLAVFFLFFVDSVHIEGGSLLRSMQACPDIAENIADTLSRSEETLNGHFALRYPFYDLSGSFYRLIGQDHVKEIFRLDNGHLVKNKHEADVSESLEGLVRFSDFCSGRGVGLIYVNLPHKIAADSDLEAFGQSCSANRNADLFLEQLRANKIDHIDMREYFRARYEDPYDAFFRTDHHWKISAGLYCAQVLSAELNKRYHLGLSADSIADNNMSVSLMKNSWVGEYGQATGATYSGMDDFELIRPNSETHFHLEIPSRNIDTDGGFSVLMNETVLERTGYYKRRYGPSLYYSYLFGNDPVQILQNQDQPAGRILIIKDSFAQAVNPFLAMTANTIVSWDLRYNDMDLLDYIEQNDFDLVIVMYTSSMIGRELIGRFMFDFS